MNKVILVGRLTKDPDYATVGSKGTERTNITLAVNRRYAAQGGKKLTDFISCVAWGKTAETMAKYLTKGSRILVEDGRIETDSYDAQDGQKRYVTQVVIERFQFLDFKNASGSTNSNVGFTEISDEGLPF